MLRRNEPDLNSNCITYYSWLEHYTLQSQAIQNAFADGNADVATGMIPCPASISSCPLQPLIYASAFAQSTFATTQSTAAGAAVSPYKANYTADFYAYMGAETVQNERMPFPPYAFNNQPFTPSGAQWGGRTDLQNMNAFSLHSYGKTGFQMFQLGSQTAAQIAAVRPPLGPSSPAVIPYVVTEHAAHTTAQWNPIASTSDINYEAARLGTQILFHSLNGECPSALASRCVIAPLSVFKF